MDARLTKIRDLINERERIDTELESLIAGAPAKERKPKTCSKCGAEGHSARTCTKEEAGA